MLSGPSGKGPKPKQSITSIRGYDMKEKITGKMKGRVEIWEGEYGKGTLIESKRNAIQNDLKYQMLRWLGHVYDSDIESDTTQGNPCDWIIFKSNTTQYRVKAIKKFILESTSSVRFLATLQGADFNGQTIDGLYLGGQPNSTDWIELTESQYTGGDVQLNLGNQWVVAMNTLLPAHVDASPDVARVLKPSRNYDPEHDDESPEYLYDYHIQKKADNNWYAKWDGSNLPVNNSWFRPIVRIKQYNEAPTNPYSIVSINPISKTSSFALTVAWVITW